MKPTLFSNLASYALILAAAALIMVGSGSCATMALWNSNPSTTSETTYTNAGGDTVRAFGKTQRDSTQLKSGSLIMMGEKYWYAVDKNDSAELLPVLQAKLPQRYRIFDRQGKELTAMPVTVTDNGKHFESSFCLRYNPANAQEAALLKDLGFDSHGKEPDYFQYCTASRGTLFGKPTATQADYRFEQAVPVALRVRTVKTHTNGGNVAAKILGTPFTLVADAALTVVALPFVALGGVMTIHR